MPPPALHDSLSPPPTCMDSHQTIKEVIERGHLAIVEAKAQDGGFAHRHVETHDYGACGPKCFCDRGDALLLFIITLQANGHIILAPEPKGTSMKMTDNMETFSIKIVPDDRRSVSVACPKPVRLLFSATSALSASLSKDSPNN